MIAVIQPLSPADYMYSYQEPHDYWVVGFHRSGTNWLARMLLDVSGLLDLERYVPTDLYVVGRLHWHLHVPPGAHLNGGGKTIFIHRDPRDILVSMALMWAHTLKDVDGVIAEAVHKMHRSQRKLPTLEAIDKIFQHWLIDYEADCITSYHALWTDTAGELDRIVRCLGIDPKNDPSEVAKRHTVEITISKFEDGSGDQSAMSPAAGPGIGLWKDVFTGDQGLAVQEALGEWLFNLKYEAFPFWHAHLPRER